MIVLLLALSGLGAGQAPVVRKIEPPNWWVDFMPDLSLLLTGENLSGAHAATASKGVRILGSDASANGHYLFVRLQVLSPTPSTILLEVNTPSGSTSVRLPLLFRADSRSRFEGFSQDDVIYLIMPDRFADGDPSNNEPTNDKPPGSIGIHTIDRSNPMAYHGGDLRGIHSISAIFTTSV